MENASKALIIAGAILLSILLISLGIMIFTQAQDVVQGSGMTEAQISSFNSKFTKYEGAKKGTLIRSLIQEVLATNATSEENDDIEVTVNGTDEPDTVAISNNRTYFVQLEYGDSGRVSNILIYEGNSAEGTELNVGTTTGTTGP